MELNDYLPSCAVWRREGSHLTLEGAESDCDATTFFQRYVSSIKHKIDLAHTGVAFEPINPDFFRYTLTRRTAYR
jgi:hypothetical protein